MPGEPQRSPYADDARWTALAADYERYGEAFTAQFARAALALAGGVAPGERVLDVAAGTGALALAAAQAGASVLATDFSPGMVARLGERLQPFAGSGARVMDGQSLDVADATFDASFAMFGVMMFPDWARGLAELVRATRPAGRVVVATWSNVEGAGLMQPFMAAFRSTFPEATIPPPPAGVTALSTSAGCKAAMIAAGCSDVAVHMVAGVWGGASLDHCMAEVRQARHLVPLYAGLDDNGCAALEGPLRDAMSAYVEADGSIRVPSTANVAIGNR